MEEPYSTVYLKIRRTLAESIEEREIGEVWDQGMSGDYMDLSLDIIPSEENEQKIRSILQSLNLLDRAELIYE
ncbi:hypothetical protein [Litoribacter populi]|uniref:hypothetical protein n=1 Tax=Litoribacter populi TaxID=2598460 RepID=UPI001180E878|nr:hypothetical protein [Litoribacter populi]